MVGLDTEGERRLGHGRHLLPITLRSPVTEDLYWAYSSKEGVHLFDKEENALLATRQPFLHPFFNFFNYDHMSLDCHIYCGFLKVIYSSTSVVPNLVRGTLADCVLL